MTTPLSSPGDVDLAEHPCRTEAAWTIGTLIAVGVVDHGGVRAGCAFGSVFDSSVCEWPPTIDVDAGDGLGDLGDIARIADVGEHDDLVDACDCSASTSALMAASSSVDLEGDVRAGRGEFGRLGR